MNIAILFAHGFRLLLMFAIFLMVFKGIKLMRVLMDRFIESVR